MSRFGDDRQFMNDLSEQLEQRASEIGDMQAIREVLEVAQAHIELYRMPDDAPTMSDEFVVSCPHGSRVLNPLDGHWHCSTCGEKVL
jgi:hypothetical protein